MDIKISCRDRSDQYINVLVIFKVVEVAMGQDPNMYVVTPAMT